MNLQEYKNQEDPKAIIWWVKLERKDIKILSEDEKQIILRVNWYPEFQYSCVKEIWEFLWSTRKGKSPKPTCFILNFKV